MSECKDKNCGCHQFERFGCECGATFNDIDSFWEHTETCDGAIRQTKDLAAENTRLKERLAEAERLLPELVAEENIISYWVTEYYDERSYSCRGCGKSMGDDTIQTMRHKDGCLYKRIAAFLEKANAEQGGEK